MVRLLTEEHGTVCFVGDMGLGAHGRSGTETGAPEHSFGKFDLVQAMRMICGIGIIWEWVRT